MRTDILVLLTRKLNEVQHFEIHIIFNFSPRQPSQTLTYFFRGRKANRNNREKKNKQKKKKKEDEIHRAILGNASEVSITGLV